MKLIIDIPEDVVTAIQNGQDYRYDIHTAIAQGKPYDTSGEWICDYRYLDVKCSLCHSYALERGDYPELSKYCPHCGALMKIPIAQCAKQ